MGTRVELVSILNRLCHKSSLTAARDRMPLAVYCYAGTIGFPASDLFIYIRSSITVSQLSVKVSSRIRICLICERVFVFLSSFILDNL